MVKYCSLFLVVMLVLLTSPAMAEDVVINRILVKINDTIITEYDLNQELKPVLKQIKGKELNAQEQAQFDAFRIKTLESMVNDILVQQEIARFDIQVTDEVIDKEMTRMKEDRGMDDEAFAAQVAEDGLTMEEFRSKLKKIIQKQELIGYMVNQKVLVTDSEIQADYDAHIDDYTLEKMVNLAMILLPTNIGAAEVKKRIEDGEMTFAEAAAEYSIGPDSDTGGVIGEVAYADMSKDWTNAIDGLKAGQVSEPFVINGNEALLSPVAIMDNRVVPLEDVKDSIYRRLMKEKRVTVFDEYFEKLKQSAVIIYMDKTLMPENGAS